VLGDGRPAAAGLDHPAPSFFERCRGIQAGPPFNLPTKAVAAADGEVYVSDGYGNSRVHRFAPDGRLLASWGETGSGPGEFHVPHAVALHPDGRLLVADRENDRIQVFDRAGELAVWREVRRPTDIAFDRQGNVYVSELPRLAANPGRDESFVHGRPDRDLPGRVSILSSSGEPLARLGEDLACDAGGFAAPHSVAVDAAGSLYVAEVVTAFARPEDGGCPRLRKFERAGA